jgi:hypothetical protein
MLYVRTLLVCTKYSVQYSTICKFTVQRYSTRFVMSLSAGISNTSAGRLLWRCMPASCMYVDVQYTAYDSGARQKTQMQPPQWPDRTRVDKGAGQ